MKVLVKFAFAMLMLSLLAGCGHDMQDLKDWVAEQKSRSAPPIEPLPEIKPQEIFTYQAEDLRDPFSLSMSGFSDNEPALNPKSGPKPDMNRRKQPLENFPLDSLKMIGTFQKGEMNWGLVQDPEGLIHKVRPGQYLGQNYGQIKNVYEDKIDLVELVPDGLGGYQEREASLALDAAG
ncbi:MAG: pilus assembly protein PilP [bacterium]